MLLFSDRYFKIDNIKYIFIDKKINQIYFSDKCLLKKQFVIEIKMHKLQDHA